MSLPASVPPGLTVATFRAGLARGAGAVAAAARPWRGGAAPGDYRSPFQARLRAARAAVVVLALLWLAAGFHGLNATASIVRTVGYDTAPSVSSAEAIRTGLAAANADYALAMLSDEGSDGAILSSMRRRLRAVRAALVDAAANITYGDEERGPIGTVLQGLGDYEQAVGRSIASAGDARRSLAFAADDLMHWTVLPAAATLERVNADHLAAAYGDYLRGTPLAWLTVATLLLLAPLAAVQVDIARTARRLVNPGLAGATLVVASASAVVALRLLAAQGDLRTAKVDAFDSVYALSTARALAADADAAESFALLAEGDPARARRQRDSVDALAARLLPIDGEVAIRSAKAGRSPGGYLGDELANTTFPGEDAAATAAVRAWGTVLQADRALGAARQRGDGPGAVSVKSSAVPSGAQTAFMRFDAALGAVLAINQRAFAASISSAECDDAPLGALLAAGFVLAVAAAGFGIGRRLDDYRF